MTRLGVYYAPEHTLKEDRDYIRALQPNVIRILDPDVQHIADMHGMAPNAIIAPRTWAIDDHDGRAVRNLMNDPLATGRDHAEQYRAQWDRWQDEARQRGLRLPAIDRMMFNCANEPNQGGTPDKIAAYSVAFLNRCTELGIRATAPCLGVGWPDNTGPDTPVNWQPYADAGLVEAINRGDHWLELHEYFYKTGPQEGWRWWAGRHLQCPFNVPILLGEIGIDNFVDAERWKNEGGNRGWVGNVSAEQYAQMITWQIRNSDTRVVSALPFITDFRHNSWESFNTRPAHGALLAYRDRMVPQVVYRADADPTHTVYIPTVGTPPSVPTSAPTEPQPQSENWQRAISFVLRWEGEFSTDVHDPGNYVDGQFVGTKYGISGNSYPDLDIANLTLDEAKAIYFRDYWLASGADGLDWPLCLAHFDTAVNAGVHRAGLVLTESGGDFLRYMATVLHWYTQLAAFDRYGRMWVRRRADVLREAAT